MSSLVECLSTRVRLQELLSDLLTHSAVELVEPQLFPNNTMYDNAYLIRQLVCWIHPLRSSEVRQHVFCIVLRCV